MVKGSWDHKALLIFVLVWQCPPGITCYLKVTFVIFSMTSWAPRPGVQEMLGDKSFKGKERAWLVLDDLDMVNSAVFLLKNAALKLMAFVLTAVVNTYLW